MVYQSDHQDIDLIWQSSLLLASWDQTHPALRIPWLDVIKVKLVKKTLKPWRANLNAD